MPSSPFSSRAAPFTAKLTRAPPFNRRQEPKSFLFSDDAIGHRAGLAAMFIDRTCKYAEEKTVII